MTTITYTWAWLLEIVGPWIFFGFFFLLLPVLLVSDLGFHFYPLVCVWEMNQIIVCVRTLLKEDCIFQEKVKDVLTYIWKTILKTLNVLEDGFT
jgi:hypothetical protein